MFLKCCSPHSLEDYCCTQCRKLKVTQNTDSADRMTRMFLEFIIPSEAKEPFPPPTLLPSLVMLLLQMLKLHENSVSGTLERAPKHCLCHAQQVHAVLLCNKGMFVKN